MVIKKYKKNPITVEAVQWKEDNIDDIKELSPDNKIHIIYSDGDVCLSIDTKEGRMIARPNTWIIKGIKGEIYPCQDNIFKETYTEEK